MFKVSQNYVAMIVGLTLAVGLMTTSAQAQDQAGAPTVTVRYGDLNLNTSKGVSVLYQRLKAASKQVCRSHEGRDLARAMDWRACYDQALSAGVNKANLETLSALHRKSAHEKLS